MSIESRAFAETREIGVYLPAGYADDRAYPLVILHDGKDFVDHADLIPALDNLIHQGEVPPFIAVLTQPGERNGEYTGDPRHADFLTGEVLPVVRERFPIRRGPENSVLMGSSLGAVASLATAFRHPGVYGALALMSGSFIFDRELLETRDPLFERIADLVDAVRADPARLPKRIFVGCGIYEGLIGQNRILARFLQEQGADVRFLETRDGHHWQNWRDQLQAALTWTLPAAAVTPLPLASQPDRTAAAGRGGGCVAEITRTIGLSLGADICWPICYEELIRRLDLKIPHEGDTLRFHVERVTIEPFDLQPAEPLRRRHRPADALVPYQPRMDQKGDPAQRTLRLQQSLVAAVERKAHHLLRDDAPRPAGARHLADPAQGL